MSLPLNLYFLVLFPCVDCCLNSWDVAVPDTTPTPATSGAQTTVQTSNKQPVMRKSSIFDKVLDKLQEIVFQKEGKGFVESVLLFSVFLV